jgi:hypothetical protein
VTGLVNDLRVEAYLTVEATGVADWVDLSDRLHTDEEGIAGWDIQYGAQGNNDTIPEPASFKAQFHDTDGVLNPDNVLGTYYTSIDEGTPLRAAVMMTADDFTRTVSGGWGSTPEGFAWSTSGAGGSVLSTDFAVAAGVGTHSVPTTVAYRRTTLAPVVRDAEQWVRFQLPFSNTTGGPVEPANLFFRKNATGEILLRVQVNADETITVQWKYITVGGVETNLSSAETWVTAHSGQAIWVYASVENAEYRVKLWADGSPEPFTWLLDTQYDAEETFTIEGGTFGIRTGVGSGNTNTKPIVVSYDGYRWRSARFAGTVTSIVPQPVDPSLNFILTEIEAHGPLQQVMLGNAPTISTLRRSIPEQLFLQAYWPMEDGSDSTQFVSGITGQRPMVVIDGTPSYASYTALKASKPLPTMNGAVWYGEVPEYVDTGENQVRWFMCPPAAGSTDGDIICRFYTELVGAWFWQLLYKTGGDLVLEVRSDEATLVHDSGTLNTNLDGIPVRVSVELTRNGSDVDWKVVLLPIGAIVGSVYSGTFTTTGLATVKRVFFNNNWNVVRLAAFAVGHCTVQSGITTIFDVLDETNAYAGERTFARLLRLGTENAFHIDVQPGRDAHLYMGPQKPEGLPTLIRQCVDVGAGVLFESRGHRALSYREVTSLYSREFLIAVDFQQLQQPWRPTYDNRDIRNKFTVSRVDGSEGTYELTTGRRSTLPRGQGGSGVYSSSLAINARDDELLVDQAALRVSLGTSTGPRYQNIVIERAAPNVVADTTLNYQLLDARPGDRIEVPAEDGVFMFDTYRQVIAGYQEHASRFVHRFEFATRPSAPYDGFKLESSTFGRIGTDTTTLDIAVNSSATSLQIVSTGEWWDFSGSYVPFDIEVDGERMTVTAISNPTPSFVAVGAAAHADNATVTPGLPGGTTTAGDALVILAGARDLNAQPGLPSGYIELATIFNQFRLFGKYHSGSETAPNVTISGGSAGVTNSAQMASFRNTSLTVLASAVSDNSSAQNIPFPAAASTAYKAMAIVAGHKADDWTSVATVTSATEIGEPSSTLGNDQGIAWDYKALTDPPAFPSGSFVVTGGTSALSKGMTVLLAVPQVLTVTRNVNGGGKAHAAGAVVREYRPPRWAL